MAVENNREQEKEARLALHNSISDPGTRALLSLLRLKQDSLNRSWLDLAGDDLTRAQGEAQTVRTVLRWITEPK